jgi:Tfp pilus assembly protein PilX
MRMLRLLQREDGIALVMVLGILLVLTIAGTTVTLYSTSNARTVNRSAKDERSFSLSEAGLNNAMAVLANPTNNALDPDTLPSTEATASSVTYENGTVKWWGVLDRGAAVWTITALGLHANGTGPNAAQVRRTLTAKVSIQPTYTQPLNNPVWNYLYAGGTGSTCDQSLNNNIVGASRMYVAGNLCLSPNVSLAQSVVIVGGNLDVANNAAVGASTDMSTRVQTYVGGNCRYGTGSWVTCTGNQDANHIYSKYTDGTTIGVDHNPPVIVPPTADFASWYENAIPGPSQSCTTFAGTTPTFDTNYPARDNSVPTVFDLTPVSSYICRVGPGASTTLASAASASQTTVTVSSASGFPTSQYKIRIDDEVMTVTGGYGTPTWTVTRGANGTTAASHASSQTVIWDDATPSGELSWNASTKTLTVKGTIYIDGSAKVSNSSLNTYNGQAALYLSGTLRLTGSLCGAVSGSACSFANWNPNSELLTIVANGSGGSQVNPGDSIQVDNNFSFQGALFATNAVEFGNNVNIGGPVVGSHILLSNNLTTNNFPIVTTVPAGMPSNPAVFAQPNPPQSFAG